MNLGELKHAIEKFENVKKSIENEIVYENPMLFVNICNQLGNCYLNTDRLQKALDNFELSLRMITKIEDEREAADQPTSPLVVAKLCLNIALIRSKLGFYEEAVYMHERSLMYKSQVLPKLDNEIRDQNILLAFAQQRADRNRESC